MVDAQFSQPVLERLPQPTLPAHCQPPRARPLLESRDHVGQHQGILLRLQAAHAYHAQLLVVVPARERHRRRHDVRLLDERDGDLEERLGLAVLGRYAWSNRNHRDAPRERPPDRIQNPAREL